MVKFTPQSAYFYSRFDRHNVNMSTVFSLIFRTDLPLVRGILRMLCIKISNSVYTVKIYSFFISDLRQKGQLTVLTKNTFWSQNVSFGEIVARFIKSLQMVLSGSRCAKQK